MKKLLIAMSAAAMFSLCAKADSLLGGINFETGYSAGDPIATGSTDPGSESALIFWAGDNGESQIAVEGEGSTANKYLKVDTTAPLVRQTAESGASAEETVVAPVAIDDGDITVSAKVQFTAADEAPEAAEDDKLIVWAKAPEDGAPEGTKPKLCVTDGTATQQNPYIETSVEINPEQWYSLEIKATKTGSGLEKTASFDLFLDGTKVGTYASRVIGGEFCQTIASIGFKGTGAVDDIVFAKNEAAVPVPVTVSYTVNGAADDPEDPIVTISDADGESIGNKVNVGETITFIVGAGEEATVTCSGLEFTWVSDDENEGWLATYTLTAADGEAGSKTFVITVAEGGQGGEIVPDMTGVPSTVTFSPEFAASYAAGDTIDPTQITASTSRDGYAVSFEILVNGTKITQATTLDGTETITVTATETAIEYTITYTYADANSNPLTDVENTNPTTFTVESETITIDTAKISKAGYTVTSVTPATIAQGTTENQTVAVVLTAVPTYTVTAAAVDGATVTFSTTNPVVSGTTVTFTIAVNAQDKEVDTVSDGTNTLTPDGQGVYSVTVADADIQITVTLKNKTTPAGDWPATWNNGAAATTAQATAFTEWAKTNDATAENAQAAFLTGQDVATYKEVAFTSITIADNKVVLTVNVDLSKANGVVKIKYGTTPTSLTNTAELGAELPATAAAQFYQIVVDFQ